MNDLLSDFLFSFGPMVLALIIYILVKHPNPKVKVFGQILFVLGIIGLAVYVIAWIGASFRDALLEG